MTFSWEDYCDLACRLGRGKLEGANREACLRTAVSRAYYSIFCNARDYVVAKRGGQRIECDEHRFVRRWFAGRKDSDSKTIAANLGYLHEKRCQADYDMTPRDLDLRRDAQLCVCMARELLELLSHKQAS